MSSCNYNTALLKFQSLHFHTCLALASRNKVIKGYKALNRFCQMHDMKDFSRANVEIRQKTKRLKFLPFINYKSILQHYGELETEKVLNDTYLYYSHYLSNPYDNKRAFDSLLYKLDSFFQFPFSSEVLYSHTGDYVAVALARYLDFPVLIEKQLCGIFMICFDLYQKSLIDSFDFQDVIDFLEPDAYQSNNVLFRIHLNRLSMDNDSMYSSRSVPDPVQGCFNKTMQHAKDSLKGHQLQCFKEFQKVSKRELTLDKPKQTLFEKAMNRAGIQ